MNGSVLIYRNCFEGPLNSGTPFGGVSHSISPGDGSLTLGLMGTPKVSRPRIKYSLSETGLILRLTPPDAS